MKRSLKRILYALFIILIVPLWLLYLLQSLLMGRMKSFEGYSQLMSLFPGLFGNYLRWAFYKLTLDRLGEDTCICFGVTMADPGIRIGRGVYIGSFCNLGLCTIEDDVLLGTDVHIISGFAQHGYKDLDVPMRDQKRTLVNVSIGRDSWIGNKAVVGSNVGEKSIIGAASLVNHDVPPYSIAAGNPAKVIKDRRQQSAKE
jgi:virginiamycin A acetyltransferase